MGAFLQTIAVPLALIAVGIVLVLGLWNLLKGGSGNTSQKLMRMRVLLQGIAIALVMFTLWVLGK
ncbi:MAG: twin transmembrane helix small protein [Xanthobacteraceae bacterium]|nr:twin transmembrane helix small protein [Xanthobacteraceae bacterium]MBX3522466.1 twin transmembrane helix small protein [Xanthobacteraceae bacterium]MBX3532890.1 twin transmembrane helix small protein [Xanthobacteraceae bacterium]MBX3550787.1 twin transmembrane helix small protein [Xanthobacteraceae bacterium]MCW5673017.1 twin transmembrane helix small protein [Xanthobacteraceae bacterium]